MPTVFNFLGPLANPARPRHQVVGVSDTRMAEQMVRVLAANGAERALVVYGHDGLDELTTTRSSTVELGGGEVRTLTVDPADHGLGPGRARRPEGWRSRHQRRLSRRVLGGEAGHRPRHRRAQRRRRPRRRWPR